MKFQENYPPKWRAGCSPELIHITFWHYDQGRNEGGKVGTIYWAPNHYGGVKSLRGSPKSPNNVTSTSFNTIHLLPKELRFEHGGAKLTFCRGRHATSLRPWLRHLCLFSFELNDYCWCLYVRLCLAMLIQVWLKRFSNSCHCDHSGMMIKVIRTGVHYIKIMLVISYVSFSYFCSCGAMFINHVRYRSDIHTNSHLSMERLVTTYAATSTNPLRKLFKYISPARLPAFKERP